MKWILFIIISSSILIDYLFWIIEYNGILNANHQFNYKHNIANAEGKELPQFSFNQFLKFYNLNPESWELCTKYNTYVPAKIKYDSYKVSTGFHSSFYETNFIYHPIFFTNIFEYRKYKKWAKKQKEDMKNLQYQKTKNAATQDFCKLVQEDIDTARKNMENALNETETTIIKVLKNEGAEVFNNESI